MEMMMERAPRVGLDGKLTRTYRKWSSMVQRCRNPRHKAWGFYGGRGVKVSEEWERSFDAFWRDMGEAPAGSWLDRIDNGRGYEAGNCRWVSPKESAANRRSRLGEVVDPGSLMQKAKRAGLSYNAVYLRIRSGLWSEEEALSVPIGAKRHRKEE